ncbi:MAG: MBL fold metallo-hydrolase [Terriglobia bacterium]
MRVKFWGVRGSTPTPQSENLRYGGNTPCLEFRSDGGSLLIVDCGTGLRMLGKSLTKEFGDRPICAHVLLSHYHWDHIQGLPFFFPLYQKANQFHFHSFNLPYATLEEALEGQMANPYFPVKMSAMLASRSYTEIKSAPFTIDDFTIQARRINHPQGCLSFRIENNGKTVVYATDNEPGATDFDRGIRELARGADILVYDSQYNQAELGHEKKGWGHSSWEEGVKVCVDAGVKQFILFHHDPDSDDLMIDRLQEKARLRFPNSRASFEGMEIVL